MEGWTKLHRKFLSWEWFDISDMVKLFIFLLLSANHTDGIWRGIEIKRGQYLTGLNSLNEKTKISIQTLRTCLKRLEKTGEINMQVTNKYRLITICKYESYQDTQQATNKLPNKQLTSNQQATNSKQEEREYKNVNKEKNISKIQEKFYHSLEIFVKDFDKKTIREFYDYWSEPNKSKTKIKFQLEKTWDTKLRLARWTKNNFNEKNRTNNKGFKSDTTEAAIQSVKNGFVDYTPGT